MQLLDPKTLLELNGGGNIIETIIDFFFPSEPEGPFPPGGCVGNH